MSPAPLDTTFDKDPVDDLDFGYDLAGELAPGETIVSLVISVDPVGLITTHDPVIAGSIVATWVAGGAVGNKVKVSLKATTNNVPPRVFERSLTIFVKEL